MISDGLADVPRLGAVDFLNSGDRFGMTAIRVARAEFLWVVETLAEWLGVSPKWVPTRIHALSPHLLGRAPRVVSEANLLADTRSLIPQKRKPVHLRFWWNGASQIVAFSEKNPNPCTVNVTFFSDVALSPNTRNLSLKYLPFIFGPSRTMRRPKFSFDSVVFFQGDASFDEEKIFGRSGASKGAIELARETAHSWSTGNADDVRNLDFGPDGEKIILAARNYYRRIVVKFLAAKLGRWLRIQGDYWVNNGLTAERTDHSIGLRHRAMRSSAAVVDLGSKSTFDALYPRPVEAIFVGGLLSNSSRLLEAASNRTPLLPASADQLLAECEWALGLSPSDRNDHVEQMQLRIEAMRLDIRASFLEMR